MRKLVVVLGLTILSFGLARECDAGFRRFEHAGGSTCVPENPERIVTTQDQNALLPLLELGVKPVASAGLVGDDGSTSFRRAQGYSTEGVAFVGSYGEPNLEAIAAQRPDLIVASPYQETLYGSLSAVAPTVLIDVHDRPLGEGLMDFARLVGREARARGLAAAYRERVQNLLEGLGERRDVLSVSVIVAGDLPGTFYRADQGQAVGTVMNDLGLLRPAAQRGPETDGEYLSVEALRAHDADVALVFDFSGEGQSGATQAFLESPTFRALAVSRAGQAYVVDGTKTVGAAWGKMTAYLDELERILLDPALRTGVVQE